MLTLAGGNDVLATLISVPVEGLTVVFRVLLVVAPIVTWLRRVSARPRSPRRADGATEAPASVILVRTPTGGFTEADR